MSNMCDDEQRAWVNRVYGSLDLTNQESDLPNDTEVILDYDLQKYYLVSFSRESVFWLVEVDDDLVTKSLREVLSDAHLRVYFPSKREMC